MQSGAPARVLSFGILLASLGLLSLFLFKHLSYPLLWNDEGETVMFGVHVLEYGYPKVHGPTHIVFPTCCHLPEIAIDPDSDAYRGTTWGQFYFATLGVLLAEGVESPYARTLRLRLPFALAGIGGLGLLVLAVLPALADRRRRLVFAAGFFTLCALSVPLLLHLREARYPPLLVLLSSSVLLVWWRGLSRGRALGPGATLCLLVALLATFNTFFPAYASLVVGLALDRGIVEIRSGGTWRQRAGRLGRSCAPLIVSGVLVVPFLVFYGTLTAAQQYVAGVAEHGYVWKLAAILRYLALHQLLVPWIVVRLALLRLPGAEAGQGERPMADLSRLLLVLSLVHVALTAANPLPFSRYLVIVGPWITAGLLLDAMRLVPRLRAAPAIARRFAGLALVLALGLPFATLVPLVGERWHEIRVPYRGPLDHAVAFIQERYGETADLVLLTNQESTPLMYYLGSRVIGYTTPVHLDPASTGAPHVVLVRVGYHSGALSPFLEQAEYERRVLPVADRPSNNVPELEWLVPLPDLPVHAFRSRAPGPGSAPAVVHWRPR